MVFDAIFQRFLEAAPACVMHRVLVENFFTPNNLDRLFRNVARAQQERELLFSTVVELTSQVVCRLSKYTRTAYLAQRDRISASMQAFYDKLQSIELEISKALVRFTARQGGEWIDHCDGMRQTLAKALIASASGLKFNLPGGLGDLSFYGTGLKRLEKTLIDEA
jgi:hypothetical protein